MTANAPRTGELSAHDELRGAVEEAIGVLRAAVGRVEAAVGHEGIYPGAKDAMLAELASQSALVLLMEAIYRLEYELGLRTEDPPELVKTGLAHQADWRARLAARYSEER